MSSEQISAEDKECFYCGHCGSCLEHEVESVDSKRADQIKLDRSHEVSDAEIDAVYNLRWSGHEPVDTGCAINNARAIIHQELGAARAALEAVKHE